MEGNLENNQAYETLRGKIVSIPQIDATLSKSGYAADSKTVGDALAERVKKYDIVNNLITGDADKPLSALQGKVLKGEIDKINLSQAGTVGYNNALSGLSATNMQSGLDEVAGIAKGALPLNGGGRVTGAVEFQNTENGYGSVKKNNTTSVDYGTEIIDVLKDGTSAKLAVSARTGVNFTDVEGNEFEVLHEGKKAAGNYTGNGTASPTTLNIHSIGKMLMVYCSDYMSFVTPKGAFVVSLADGTFSWVDGSKVSYENGELKIETANEEFNGNGTAYFYQAI